MASIYCGVEAHPVFLTIDEIDNLTIDRPQLKNKYFADKIEKTANELEVCMDTIYDAREKTEPVSQSGQTGQPGQTGQTGPGDDNRFLAMEPQINLDIGLTESNKYTGIGEVLTINDTNYQMFEVEINKYTNRYIRSIDKYSKIIDKYAKATKSIVCIDDVDANASTTVVDADVSTPAVDADVSTAVVDADVSTPDVDAHVDKITIKIPLVVLLNFDDNYKAGNICRTHGREICRPCMDPYNYRMMDMNTIFNRSDSDYLEMIYYFMPLLDNEVLRHYYKKIYPKIKFDRNNYSTLHKDVLAYYSHMDYRSYVKENQKFGMTISEWIAPASDYFRNCDKLERFSISKFNRLKRKDHLRLFYAEKIATYRSIIDTDIMIRRVCILNRFIEHGMYRHGYWINGLFVCKSE